MAPADQTGGLDALDLRLQLSIVKEQKDALDNLCNSAGFVGIGNGNLLYRRRADSRPVGRCVGSNGNSPDSGAEDCVVLETYPAAVHQVIDWVSDCYLASRSVKEHAVN
jgi:hypothetical protein